MLTEEACRILVQNLVISHLDYDSALFIGLPDCNLDKVQWIQDIAAKLILGRGRMDSLEQGDVPPSLDTNQTEDTTQDSNIHFQMYYLRGTTIS